MKKAIIVTGGTKGIGKAICEKFAQEGYDIVTCSRKEIDLTKLKSEIENKYKGITLYYQVTDMADKKSIENFVYYIQQLPLQFDALINNAGLFVQGQVHNEPDGVLETMISVNLYSAYHLTRAIVPQLIARKSGHIFNICSTASIVPYINGGSYCISKFALLGFTKVLREELKLKNVKVTAILPGATYTDSWSGSDIPIERFMPSEEIAKSIFDVFALKGGVVVEELLVRPQLGDL
jgi:short-subunit dehydrogenase